MRACMPINIARNQILRLAFLSRLDKGAITSQRYRKFISPENIVDIKQVCNISH